MEKPVRTVIGHNMFPVVNGSNVTFSCPPGLILSGPNMAVCMGNGKWEPDPRMVKCTGEIIMRSLS